jgi:hypothetical protein
VIFNKASNFYAIFIFLTGGDVHVAEDPEFKREVVGCAGNDSYIEFLTSSSLPFVAFHLKNEDCFLSITITIKDDQDLVRKLIMSNKRSIIHANQNLCELPMIMGPGWQYINLDLVDMVDRAFGSMYVSTRAVQISGTCRMSKIYFQDREYADVELPTLLRLMNK